MKICLFPVSRVLFSPKGDWAVYTSAPFHTWQPTAGDEGWQIATLDYRNGLEMATCVPLHLIWLVVCSARLCVLRELDFIFRDNLMKPIANKERRN